MKIRAEAPLYISLAEAAHLTNLSTSSITRLEVADPTFPRISRISNRKCLIRRADLEVWIDAQAGKKPDSLRGRAEAVESKTQTAKAP